jgi:pseudaminic acid cytidylyltransferase
MNICIIPARGGSKRIKSKNIKPFFGKPMIGWAINTALNAKIFDKIIVSTDDLIIKEISLSFGAEVPFLRPKNLSGDKTSTISVIKHAVQKLKKNNFIPKFVCCLYPCSPFLNSQDLKNTFKEIQNNKNNNFLYPVVEFPHPSFRAMKRHPDGTMEFIFPNFEIARTQDLQQTFHDAGQFYWGRAETWINKNKMHSNGIGVVFPKWKFIDIDDENDWKKAELLYEIVNKSCPK